MWLILSFVVAWAMSHLLVFCRESHFVANTCFLGLFCADFYADICDLTQILRIHLDKKSAAESSEGMFNFCLYKSSIPEVQILWAGYVGIDEGQTCYSQGFVDLYKEALQFICFPKYLVSGFLQFT